MVLFQIPPIKTVNIFCEFGLQIPLNLIYVHPVLSMLVMSSPKNLTRLIAAADLKFKFKYVILSLRRIVKRQRLFIYTYMYVTMVYWRSASQGCAQKTHFDYIVRGHFETETSKSEPGTTYSRFRFRNRWNRCSFNGRFLFTAGKRPRVWMRRASYPSNI